MDKISKIEKEQITFSFKEKTITATISQIWKRRFNAFVYIAKLNNVVFVIHETLSHGITTATEISVFHTEKLYKLYEDLEKADYIKTFPKEVCTINL